MLKEDDEIQQQDQQQSPEPPAPDRIVINPNDDDDDDDGEGGAPAQAARPDGKSRRNGYRALKERTSAAEERAAKLERDVAELRGRMSAPQAPIVVRGDRAPEVDPVEAELEVIESQKAGLLVSIRSATDPAEVARLSKQWNAADRKRIKIEVAAANKADRAAQPREDMEMRIGTQTLQTNYPKLFGQNGPTSYGIEAQAEAARIQESGRGAGRAALDIANEAASIVYARHKLGPQRTPAPSDTERARYVSAPARAATTAGKEGWSPNKQQFKLAMAFTEHRTGLTDEQRVRAYYNEVLKPNRLV